MSLSNEQNLFLLDVAKLIASFDKSSNFEDAFVPSVGIGEDKEGNTILSFSLTTKYLKTDVINSLGKADEKAVVVPTVETPVVKPSVDKPMAR